MGNIQLHRKQYRTRIKWRDNGKINTITIPLRCGVGEERLAKTRNLEVQTHRQDHIDGLIKNVGEFYSWLNEEGTSRIVHTSLSESIDEYLNTYCRIEKDNQKKTLVNSKYICDRITKAVGGTMPVSEFSTDHVLLVKEYAQKNLSRHGVRNTMVRLNSFINWLYTYKIKEFDLDISDKPIVVVPSVPKKLPQYISESQWENLMNISFLTDFDKELFTFYRDTGCRLMETLLGEVKKIGNDWWLIVAADKAKKGETTGLAREIKLTDTQKDFLQMYKENKPADTSMENYGYYFSKLFKKAIRVVEGIIPENCSNDKMWEIIKKKDTPLRFHNLRDTFAIRTYLRTGDIYKVSHKMGHQDLNMTKAYANFDESRIKADFPKLAKKYVNE